MSAPTTGGAPYIQFGAALIFINPNSGNLATNPTPVKPYTIATLEIDQAADIKELRGQSQYPDDTARSDIKPTFKFSMGRTDYFLLNQAIYADVTVAGGTSVSPNEAHTVPAVSTYIVTIAPPGTGTFGEDLGVQYAGLGNLEKVASGPVQGQYSVVIATGVYTFAAADASANILISYSYTLATAGNTYQINNQVQGYSPQIEFWAVETYSKASAGTNLVTPSCVRIYAAKIGKVTFPYKRNDYKMVDCEGIYFASANGRVIDYYAANG